MSNIHLCQFLPFTAMLKIPVLTWGNYTTNCNLHNGDNEIMVLLKTAHKTMHHKDAIIFRYVHCVLLFIFIYLTANFSMESE